MPASSAGPGGTGHSVTHLLLQLAEGDRDVEARLVPHIYGELRRIGGHYMRRERGNHTLQPTALVNEAYLKLVQQPEVPWQSRAHFFATASRLMRNILVDHARARMADKRGGAQNRVTLDDAIAAPENKQMDVLVLNEALDRLATFDARQARIVELHFFGGVSFEEIAVVLKIGERTVMRDWSMARAWLKNELSSKKETEETTPNR